MVRRRAFFQEESSFVSFVMRLTIAPLHKIHVEPHLVMAALIGLSDAQSFVVNGKCTVLPYSPPLIGVRRYEKPTHVRLRTPHRPWTTQRCGLGGIGKSQSVKASCVKSIPPTTENWLRKLYTYNKKNCKSTKDKHETNHINNKYNDTNTDTRKMHNT